MIKNQLACVSCGSTKIRKNGFDPHGKRRFYCNDCGHTKAAKCGLIFKGRNGIIYTTKMILTKCALRGHPISIHTAIYRIKAAIKDPSRENTLFDAPKNKPKDLYKAETETLSDEQKETWDQFRAVNDGRMSLNDLLRS
jgi:hypothetical protein